jgi:hypothetical protein
MDRRSEVRFGANEQVVVEIFGKTPFHNVPGNVIGASKSGLRISVNVPVEMSVRVQINWASGSLMGVARYCRRILPDKYTVGLKIIGISKPSSLRTRDVESSF